MERGQKQPLNVPCMDHFLVPTDWEFISSAVKSVLVRHISNHFLILLGGGIKSCPTPFRLKTYAGKQRALRSFKGLVVEYELQWFLQLHLGF